MPLMYCDRCGLEWGPEYFDKHDCAEVELAIKESKDREAVREQLAKAAIKIREAFEFGYLGGPMFYARDEEQLDRICKNWDEHLTDSLDKLLTANQEAMRERCAAVVTDTIKIDGLPASGEFLRHLPIEIVAEDK